MNVVRICFQASYRDGDGRTRQLSPVLSEPIFDKSGELGQLGALGGLGGGAGGGWRGGSGPSQPPRSPY